MAMYMLEQVDLKIKELKKRQTQQYYKQKDADLRAWGLTTKKDGKKEIPIIVTDDEYEALIKASNGIGATGRNAVAIALNILSVAIVIIGAVAGAVVATLSENLGFVYFSLIFAGSVALGLISKGIGEAVRLLQQILDQRTTNVLTEEQKEEYEKEKKQAQEKKKPVKTQAPAQPAPQAAAPVQAGPVVYTTNPPIYQQQPQQVYQQSPQQPYQPGQPIVYTQPVYVQTYAPTQQGGQQVTPPVVIQPNAPAVFDNE